MFLRSHARKLRDEINFEEASKAWMKNKQKIGQSYVYICGGNTKSNTKCTNKVKPNTFCHYHKKNIFKI